MADEAVDGELVQVDDEVVAAVEPSELEESGPGASLATRGRRRGGGPMLRSQLQAGRCGSTPNPNRSSLGESTPHCFDVQ